MRSVAIFIFVAAVTIAASRAAVAQPKPVLHGCDLTVTFGSYASGTDPDAEAQIRAYLSRTRGLTVSKEASWGREGEHTLCVQAKSRRLARKAYSRIRSLIPDESRRAWTEVRLANGRAFRTSWPKAASE